MKLLTVLVLGAALFKTLKDQLKEKDQSPAAWIATGLVALPIVLALGWVVNL